MKNEEFNDLIRKARSTNLVDYFRTSGYQLEQHGVNYYVKEYPSLCIREDNNQWYHHYTSQGRTNNSVDCLTNILGRDFNQAVFELTGEDVTVKSSSDYKSEYKPKYTSPPKPEIKQTEKESKKLKMPEQSKNTRQLFAYFCQTRKIPANIVEELIHSNLLYQSENEFTSTVNGKTQTFRNANAVFVHKDEDGKVVGAEIQGTNSYKRYKGVATGTGDSAFMFTPVPAGDNKIKRAYIFESAIDLMSFYSFCDKNKLSGSVLVSMAGLKPTVPNRLKAEGVQIISCVDNDEAGKKFEEDNGFIRSESVKNYLDKNEFKDWNELLVFKKLNPDFDPLKNSKNNETDVLDEDDDDNMTRSK